MSENIVVSVGRQFGSRGRYVGKLIAQNLGFSFYDSELLNLAAKEIGFDPSLFEKADEKPCLPKFIQDIGQNFLGVSMGADDNYMSGEKMFEIQSQVMAKVAEDGPCVFMGRCSDYVFRNNPKCFSLFLSAPLDFRVECVRQRTGMTDEDQIRKLIEKTDNKRSDYYNYYTDKTWGHSFSYDLCVDVSLLGVEMTADFICSFIRQRFPELK